MLKKILNKGHKLIATKREFAKEKNAPTADLLANFLKKGHNPSFRYNNSREFLFQIALHIEQSLLTAINPDHVLKIASMLIKNHDYRYVADYIHARRANKLTTLKRFEEIIKADDSMEVNKLRYQLGYARFFDISDGHKKADIRFVSSANDIFSQSKQGIAVYLINSSMKLSLTALFDDTGIDLGVFIEQQYGLPGLNALVRQGVVRIWTLPDGKAIISKRNNPQKPGRFREEQLNYEFMMRKIGGKSELYLSQTPDGKSIQLKIAQPFAVIRDGYSDSYYALSVFVDGVSLEDLLMKENDQFARHKYLAHYRLILDALYDKGIIWGDMSPRNIIVKQTEQDISYHIFDFEKTQIMDEPISLETRKNHCRGQICAEELCAICTIEEVQECFRGYFDIHEWDFDSEKTSDFPQRPEVTDILYGRGMHNVVLGEYNRTDREMINLLIPGMDSVNKKRRYPSHLKFKVEHYLSCADYENAKDYECKVTEVLFAARCYNCFDNIITLLDDVIGKVEGVFLKEEFESILTGKSLKYIAPPEEIIEMLTETIDAFYYSRKQKNNFLELYTSKMAAARK